jgi:small subunit ribosomal protein S17
MSEKQKLSRTLVGKVISNRMDKTIVVLVRRQEKHNVYGKYIKRSTKIHAHDDKNICQQDDMVLIEECRPLSKTKNWKLVKVLEKSKNSQ